MVSNKIYNFEDKYSQGSVSHPMVPRYTMEKLILLNRVHIMSYNSQCHQTEGY